MRDIGLRGYFSWLFPERILNNWSDYFFLYICFLWVTRGFSTAWRTPHDRRYDRWDPRDRTKRIISPSRRTVLKTTLCIKLKEKKRGSPFIVLVVLEIPLWARIYCCGTGGSFMKFSFFLIVPIESHAKSPRNFVTANGERPVNRNA